MTRSRLWLVFVLAVFCLPLFVGLGRGDLQNDEAIYSFGVDRILESGDWLAPKRSPFEDEVFLEKPPLKFWIVAAPIRFGLLPHNEFGLRFWDAVFGSAAFLYVFALGGLIAGDLCGVAAVMILFVHPSLLFEHGLRSNNMEALLLLTYCAGIYHYLRWASAESGASRRFHAVAVGVYFALGFMDKFVAALFLPFVLGAASLAIRRYRARLIEDWRLWAWTSALAVALIAPWFVYAYHRFGDEVWQTMLTAHIVTRFTSFLDPMHLQPWYFYVVHAWLELLESQCGYLVAGGLVWLSIQAIRRRSTDVWVVMLWFALPTVAVSAGTSKLYHYFYPFLPPLSIAGGYLVAEVAAVVGPRLDLALEAIDAFLARVVPLPAVLERPAARLLLAGMTASALALGVATFVYGPIRIGLGPLGVMRSAGWLRPLAVALVCGVLGRVARGAGPVLLPLLLAVTIMPLAAYGRAIARLDLDPHPIRSARDCVLRVQAAGVGTREPGLYVDLPDWQFWHPVYYYMRQIRPWTRQEGTTLQPLYNRLYASDQWQPALVWTERFDELMRRPGLAPTADDPGKAAPPMMKLDAALLLLPGPYAACAAGDEASR